MGIFDDLTGDQSSQRAMQLQGLLGGLTQMGGLLAQAGQFRPVGTPAPSLADAFNGFGVGQKQGLLAAQQQSAMQKKMARQALLTEARGDKPDDQISPQARAMRGALQGLGPDIAALADDEQLPGLAINRATQRQRPMTAAELASGGFRPGSVVMVNDFTGNPNVVQQSDYKSPEAEAQALRISAAGRAPPSPIILGPGQSAYDRSGRPIASGPAAKPEPMNAGNAWNTIMRLAPAAASGQLDPNSPEGREYLIAQTVLTQPKPVQVTQPDGSVVQVLQPPDFPFPRLTMPGMAPGSPQAPHAAPGAMPTPSAPPPAGAAPVAPQGTVVKPPPPLTESQGNATMYLQRMQEAEKRLATAVGGGYTPGNIRDSVAGGTPLVGNFLLSERGQNYRQAQEDWVRAKLRKESGAVIADSEMKAEIKTYFPQPGDSPSTIKQKAAARQTAMDALGSSAGPGTGRITNTAPPPGPTISDPLGILK